MTLPLHSHLRCTCSEAALWYTYFDQNANLTQKSHTCLVDGYALRLICPVKNPMSRRNGTYRLTNACSNAAGLDSCRWDTVLDLHGQTFLARLHVVVTV